MFKRMLINLLIGDQKPFTTRNIRSLWNAFKWRRAIWSEGLDAYVDDRGEVTLFRLHP